MSLDSVVGIGWDVLKMVYDPIKRQVGYVTSSKRYARDLEEEIGKLKYQAERIHDASEDAKNNLRNVNSQVVKWQESANRALEKEVPDLLSNFNKADKTCCYGTLRDPICRYQFSRKAKDMIKDIQRLAQEGSHFGEKISLSGPPPGYVAAPTPEEREGKDVVQLTTTTVSASSASASTKLRDDSIFESRASIIQDIMDALADKSNSVVGVHGMGGVGKSTILVDAERRIRENTLFDTVVKADVSANPDIKRIQGEIAHWLRFSDIKKEENVSLRATLLHDRLEDEEKKKRKVLIILDNLWEQLDLKSVGIPCGHDNKVIGCKLLLTSRDQNVLLREMGCDKDFLLGGLQEVEARDLFERVAGDNVRDHEFKPLVDEALDKCAGFPFLIIAMAKFFKNSSVSICKDALKQIDMSTNEGINKVINEMLQLSYDHLKGKEGEDAKSLLRLCVASGFSTPSIEYLVRYGVGLKLFREDSSMEEARDRLNSLIHTLQTSSLLLDNEDANCFKIHDLVRGFVTSIASTDHPLLILKDTNKSMSKDKLKSCKSICFPYVDLEELPKKLDCPNIQMFLLFTKKKSLEVSDSYFNSMRNLMVLNLIGIRLNCSPSPFQFLENLCSLCLDYSSLEDVAILGELKGLQILSIANSNIHRLPKEIGQLTELRMLDLTNCSQLEIIEPGVLGSLMRLEELYMENSLGRWNPLDQTPPTNASLIELNNMKNLCTLHVSIHDPSVLPQDLNVKNLNKYKIKIGDVQQSGNCDGSSTLELKLDPVSYIVGKKCIQSILGKTDDLFLDGLDGIEQSICALSSEGFPKLKHLLVKNNPSIYYILQSSSHISFKILESLHLEDLINLEKICNNDVTGGATSSSNTSDDPVGTRIEFFNGQQVLMPSLKSLTMEGLPNLKEIWSDDSPLESSNLQSLEVVRCESLSKVINSRSLVKLHKLHNLIVEDCVSVQEIFDLDGPSSNKNVNTLSGLTTLRLKRMQSLRRIWSKNPCEMVSFHNLEELMVNKCDKLKFIFFPSMVKSLTKLRHLTIFNCEKMEAVITEEEEGLTMKTSETLTFPMITFLLLGSLDSLKCFSRRTRSREARSQDHIHLCSTALFNGEVAYPKLEILEIHSIYNFEFIFSPSMVKSLTQLKSLEIWNCMKMEAIIMEEEGLGTTTSESLAFPMLTDLKLHNLRSLTCFSRRKCPQEAQIREHIKSHSTALFNGQVAFPNLKTLHIAGMDNIEKIWDNKVAADFFPNLKSLSVDRCNRLMKLVPACILVSLESLEAKDCGSLEVVFELQPLNPPNRHPVACFPLNELKLFRLPELKCLWDNEFYRQVKFHCLRSISISGCESLTALFLASAAKDLVQLEELMIEECGIMEIIKKEEGLVPKIVFPKLRSLELKNLMELTCIYNGKHALRWPALKTLDIQGCNRVEIFASKPENEMTDNKHSLFLTEKGTFPNLDELKLDLAEQMEIWSGHFHDEEFFCKLRVLELRHLSNKSLTSTHCFVESLNKLEELVVCESYLEEPSNNEEAIGGTSHELKVMLPFSGYPRHLQSLVVSHYEGLSFMFTLTAAEHLVALKNLRISNCKMLTEVISAKEGEKGRVVAFNKLEYMELDDLIELRCFSSGGYALMFPILKDFVINGCPKMKFFSKGPIEAPKLERLQKALTELYEPEKFEYFWKGNLNITIQNMFEEMATIAGAKSMWLSDFPELIGKWHDKLNPIKSSWELESLVVDKCPSFINAIPSKLMLVLEKMTSLQVCNCELLKEIFDLEGLEAMESTRVLPQLMELNLVNLPRLKRLWKKDFQGMMRFSFLSSLILYKCSNLRHAFSPSMARCLVNLVEMEINECDQMEGVIVEEEGQGSGLVKITFPRLENIELECLPNLTSFLSGNSHTLDCPKIQFLTIEYCPKMRSLTGESSIYIDQGTPSLFTPQVQFPQLAGMALYCMDNLSKIWMDDPHEALTFDSLSEVNVQSCRNLEILFPHWVAASLTQLHILRVESSGIEEIVTSGDDAPHSDAAQVHFPKLISLILHDMPRLKSFCSSLPTLNWPFLEELRVTHCDKMNMPSFAASMNKWTQKNDQRDLVDHEAHFSFERDFPNLKRLWLVDTDVQMLRDGKLPNDIFGQTEALTLACFHDENAVFPPRFLLERFQNLQNLEVLCSSFEDIFPDEGLVDEEKHPVLENLRDLKLSKLHNLKRVWREDYSMERILQRIETFEVEDCPGLTILFPSMTSFRNLTKLMVKNSSGLIHLVTTSAITNLVHLTKMAIMRCENLKEVVTKDENAKGKVISLGKLEILSLHKLPSLVCFSSGTSCGFRFPSLKCILVEECPQMKFFSKGTLSTPELARGSSSVFGYDLTRNWDGDLNRIIKKLSAQTIVDETITH